MSGDETVVTDKTTPALILLWSGSPLAGAAAAWLIKLLAAWLVTLPWAPFQGPAELIESFPEPQVTIGALAVGTVAGLIFAAYAVNDLVTVTVTDSAVTLTRGDTTRAVQRSDAGMVFVARKTLVILGHDTGELAHQKTDLNADALERAFAAHGYPWAAGDPYDAEYRRWVDDAPDLPPGANAVFKARQQALNKGNDGDVEELRAELGKLGVVARDEKKKQYWRRTHQQT